MRVSAVKRKHRTELNPTMTQAFKTLEGKEEWSPSVVKELTTLGPKEAFAIEQVQRNVIPAGADVIMLQPEHTTKKSSGEKKTRIVVNGSQEKVKPGENNYSPTALPKGLQILIAIAAHEGRLLRGIDIKCAFGSEYLTAEDGDIWVQYPDILEDHFGYLLDQQLEEQKVILEEEARTKRVRPYEEDALKEAVKDASDGAIQWEDCDDDECHKVRNTKTWNAHLRHRSKKWIARSKKWIARKQNKANIYHVAANGESKRRRYGRLRKSLYGLRRAARLFNCGLNKLLIENGYECCPADKCIYRKTFGTESILFNTHVDDFAVFPTCEAMFDELLSVLRTKYEITVTDRLEKHLGMQVNEYENGSVGMSQPNHLQVLFDLCGYGDDHVGAEIPMPVDWNEADQDDSPKIDIEAYMKLMGSVLYVLRTRPDVAVALSKESSRTHKCTEKDMAVLKQTVSYLHKTRHSELVYTRGCSKQRDAVLEIFIWADNSHMCYMSSHGQNAWCMKVAIAANVGSAMVSWYSAKSKILALSTCEGETDAAVEGTKEATWAREVMAFCGHPQTRPTYIGEDNQAMITLASKEAGTHGRTKHFTGRINYLIDNVKNGIIRLEYLRTEDQKADGLTKPFGPKAMAKFRQDMMGTQMHGVVPKKVRRLNDGGWMGWCKRSFGAKKHVTFAPGTKEEPQSAPGE